MLRGEIRVVDLEPVVGSEADKRRPAVIVSDDDVAAAPRAHPGTLLVRRTGVRRVRVLRPSRPEGVDLAMSPHLALSPRPNFVVVPAWILRWCARSCRPRGPGRVRLA